jgi:putative transposase
MSRPLRIDFPGAIHHLTARGNGYAPIFHADGDRHEFLRVLSDCVGRFGWVCHAYCLMGNHYHLMVETPAANMSSGMRHLNGCYTQWFNWRHNRVGHIFQGRFKSILVDRDAYLLELCRYIVLNPVRAGMVAHASAYWWSSYGATSGAVAAPNWLCREWLLAQFDDDLPAARRKYIAFVEQGLGQPSPMCDVKGQVLLGPDDFVSAMRPRIEQKGDSPGVASTQRFAYRPELATLLAPAATVGKPARDELIRRAHFDFRYSKSDIARATGMHRSTIGDIIQCRP